jgi:hypothetical protein
MQMRLNDVVLDERPKFLTKHATDKDHALVQVDLTIALEIHKLSSFFHWRTPTQGDYNKCDRIELTCSFPEWSPITKLYDEEESKCFYEEVMHASLKHQDEHLAKYVMMVSKYYALMRYQSRPLQKNVR